MILEQFVGPIVVVGGYKVVVYDVDNERVIPDFPLDETIRWTANVNPAELLDGNRVASLTGAAKRGRLAGVLRRAA